MSSQQIEFLKCYFTPEERAELSERLCRAIAAKLEAEEEFKVVKTEFKERIEGHQAEINRVGRRLNFGYEHRNVTCEVLLNQPEAGKKTIMRDDVPGEIVRVMAMDEGEQAPTPPEQLFPEPPKTNGKEASAGAQA